MNAATLIAQARVNMPLPCAPDVAQVERRLRRLLEGLLRGFDYDADPNCSAAHACRALAVILAEVEDLQRMQSLFRRAN